jgi:hypothetical protein
MITEDYVSFETAKLLKEKGFDEYCRALYTSKGELEIVTRMYLHDYFTNNYFVTSYLNNDDTEKPVESKYITAPTLQMTMKWLRNTFHLEIYPFHDTIQENNDWWYRIERHSKGCGLTEHESDVIYKTYEESCEAAIKYCIENLIENEN